MNDGRIQIKKIITEYLTLEGPFETQQFVREHPELVCDEANLQLDQLIAFAISENNEEIRSFLEGRLALLKRCGEIGIDRAFAEFLNRAIRAADDENYYRNVKAEALTSFIDWWLSILTHTNFLDLPKLSKLSVLNIVARGLLERYSAFDQSDDLNRAIELFEEGAQLTSAASLEHANFKNNLGVSFRSLYRHTRELGDINQAIKYLREALNYYETTAKTDPSVPNPAELIDNLASVLSEYYIRTGNIADLNEAIEYNQQAIELNADSPSNQAHYLTTKATCYRQRYYHTGDLTDLDESTHSFRKALDYHQQACEINPAEASRRAGFLCNLGTALREQYLHSNNPNQIDQAIRYFQEALDLASKESLFLGTFLVNLGSGLRSRYLHTGDLDDLDQAIKYYRQAVERSRPNSLELAYSLDNVGNGLRDRYERTGVLGDLDEAIKFYREAINHFSKISTERPRHLNNLALALTDRYERSNDYAFLEEAFRLYEEVCEQGLKTNPQTLLGASQIWGSRAMKQSAWEEAAKAFQYGLQASDHLFRAQLLRAYKESWLQDAQKLHTYAAYTFIHNGDLVSAVQVLESGRARLLSDVVERKRTDLENLAALGFQRLYEDYRAASERLERVEKVELSQDSRAPDFDISGDIRAARRELDAAIESIRQIPKYENFLRSVEFDVVQRTLTESSSTDGGEESVGIYLIVTFAGGAAIIVHSGGVESVWLDFDETELYGLLLERDGEKIVGGYLHGQFRSSLLRPSLDKMLDLIGEKIMQPVAQALHKLLLIKTNGKRPRVILVPTGLLSLIPLHAAHYQVNGKAQTFLDDFTVAYTPSARALRHSQNTLTSLSNHLPSLVAIGDPLPLSDGLTSLTFAQAEVEEIATLFGSRAKLLFQTQATLRAVEAILDKAAYLHFACHGQFNAQKPLASGLILSNGERLTLSNVLARSSLETTRLVTLSACQTAITDWNYLPEEAIGLPSGFLQAGAPAVIGSLWSVNDLSTALLMIKFYEFHLGDGVTEGKNRMDPACALRQAQLWLRDVTNQELTELFNYYERATTSPPGDSFTAYDRAKEEYRENNIHHPNDRPFDHPYYWAAFAFYGI